MYDLSKLKYSRLTVELSFWFVRLYRLSSSLILGLIDVYEIRKVIVNRVLQEVPLTDFLPWTSVSHIVLFLSRPLYVHLLSATVNHSIRRGSHLQSVESLLHATSVLTESTSNTISLGAQNEKLWQNDRICRVNSVHDQWAPVSCVCLLVALNVLGPTRLCMCTWVYVCACTCVNNLCIYDVNLCACI